jgi:hypothetical protein
MEESGSYRESFGDLDGSSVPRIAPAGVAQPRRAHPSDGLAMLLALRSTASLGAPGLSSFQRSRRASTRSSNDIRSDSSIPCVPGVGFSPEACFSRFLVIRRSPSFHGETHGSRGCATPIWNHGVAVSRRSRAPGAGRRLRARDRMLRQRDHLPAKGTGRVPQVVLGYPALRDRSDDRAASLRREGARDGRG